MNLFDILTGERFRRLEVKVDQILVQGKQIMTKFSDGIVAVSAQLDRIETAAGGIRTDVGSLKTEIDNLKAQLGQLTPEQEAAMQAVTDRVTSIADGLTALDAETVQDAPPAEPTV